jgi:hypothetical protein
MTSVIIPTLQKILGRWPAITRRLHQNNAAPSSALLCTIVISSQAYKKHKLTHVSGFKIIPFSS